MKIQTRIFFAIILSLTIINTCFGQINKTIDNDDIYVQSVKTFVDSSFNNSPVDSNEVIFLSDLDLTNNLPSKIGKTNVLYLYHTRLREYLQKLKKDSIPIYELKQVQFSNNKLFVEIHFLIFSFRLMDNEQLKNTAYKDKYEYYYSSTGFVTVGFIFDCLKNRFIVNSVKYDK